VPSNSSTINPFVALGYAAALTSRIRLATGVCLVPEYNPLLLAKLAASLDHLSGGGSSSEAASDGSRRNFARSGLLGSAAGLATGPCKLPCVA
jgi:Luciferase-like monooxygenase